MNVCLKYRWRVCGVCIAADFGGDLSARNSLSTGVCLQPDALVDQRGHKEGGTDFGIDSEPRFCFFWSFLFCAAVAGGNGTLLRAKTEVRRMVTW
jgi:hypothetical protein